MHMKSLMACLLAGMLSVSAAAQNVKWTIGWTNANGSSYVETIKTVPARIEAATKGRLKIELYDTLVAGAEQPAAVREDGWKIAGCPVNGPQLASSGGRVAAAWFTALQTVLPPPARAFAPPLKQATRSILYLKPHLAVILDRYETGNPDDTFTLHLHAPELDQKIARKLVEVIHILRDHRDTVDEATLAVSAEAVGILRTMYDKTVEYSKNRVQFGRAIGNFTHEDDRRGDDQGTHRLGEVANDWRVRIVGRCGEHPRHEGTHSPDCPQPAKPDDPQADDPQAHPHRHPATDRGGPRVLQGPVPGVRGAHDRGRGRPALRD